MEGKELMMRSHMFGAAMAAGLILSACEAEAPKGPKGPGAEASVGQNVADRLASMPDTQRNAVFIRAIRDAGFTCQHVESSGQVGDYRGMPMWTARCRENDWAILVGSSGMVQVLDCRQAKEAGLPECAARESAP